MNRLVSKIVGLLDSDDRELRAAAARVLGALEVQDQAAVDALRAALAGGAGWIRARRRGVRWPAARSRVVAAALVLVVVYVAHAFSIGTSHYPVERYGARVQWLLALALWMWVLRLWVDARGSASGSAS